MLWLLDARLRGHDRRYVTMRIRSPKDFWAGLIFLVIAAAFVLVGAYASREVRLVDNLALAAVMIVFSVAVFVWLLGLPLPLWPTS